jgi:hypothetical protein
LKPLEKVPDSIKCLVNQGTWCCYKTKDGEYIIGTTGYSWCCNQREQKVFLVSEDGSEFIEISKQIKDFEIEKVINFPEYKDPTAIIFEDFSKAFKTT